MIRREATVLVMAGGRSDRFGRVKSLLTLDDKPLIQHVVERIGELSKELVISCKMGDERFREMFPNADIVLDDDRIKGPLAGLKSAIPHIDTEYVIVVPCDGPFVRPAVMELILERGGGHDASIPRWPNGYIEPLIAVYRTTALEEAVERAWKDGTMKLSKMIDTMEDVVYVPTEDLKDLDPDMESFINLNSPVDLLVNSISDEGGSWQGKDPLDAREDAELLAIGKAD